MTPETRFTSKLEAFFDDPVIFTDVVKKRVLFLLAEFRKEVVPPIIYRDVVVETIKYIHAEQPIQPETLKHLLVTHDLLLQHAKAICMEHNVDFEVFMSPPNGKSTVEITNIRRKFCVYIKSNYICTQETLKKFFDVNHATIVHYLRDWKMESAS